MEQNFGTALAASLIAGVVTTIGILAIRRFGAWAYQNSTYFACFVEWAPGAHSSIGSQSDRGYTVRRATGLILTEGFQLRHSD